MISVAKLILQERNISVNENEISEQMRRVMDLEKDIANVSKTSLNYPFLFFSFFLNT